MKEKIKNKSKLQRIIFYILFFIFLIFFVPNGHQKDSTCLFQRLIWPEKENTQETEYQADNQTVIILQPLNK